MFSWFAALSRSEKRTVFACSAGWGLDAMDTQMYALTIPTLIALWGMTRGEAGVLATAVLIVSAIGGWVAGVLADRIGRVRVLQLTILWFAAFTFLSGLTNSFWQLFFTRSLQGFGFGGEWAVGSVLISEAIRPAVRGRVMGVVQSGWAVGYGVAVLMSTILFSYLPQQYAWRVFFFLGLLPALMVLWIRRFVDESKVYTAAKHESIDTAAHKHSSEGAPPATAFIDIFRGPYLFKTVVVTVMMMGIFGGNYVVITWLPTYLRVARHLSVLNTGGYLAINILGSFVGALAGGFVADALGRRKMFILCALCQAATIAVYTLAPVDGSVIIALGFVMGALQSGTAGSAGAYLSELFPTRIRATAQGFCGNGGRAVGAIFPAAVGLLSSNWTLSAAMGICACSAYLVVVVSALILPETRGRDLSAVV